MRNAIFLFLRASGLPLLIRYLFQRHTVTILAYHDPSPHMFERHIALLRARYNFISLQQYLRWREGETGDRLPEFPLIVTLDDGHKGNYALKPIFEREKLPVTIFLCSAVVATGRHFWWLAHDDHEEMIRLTRIPDEARLRCLREAGFQEDESYAARQALSREEVHELRRLVDLQSHTRFHPVLPQCTDERARDEIVGSRAELRTKLGLVCDAIALPNGDYSDRDLALIKQAGYRCALTLDRGFNGANTSLFRLRRLRMSDDAGQHEVIVKASGVWAFIEGIFPTREYGYVARPRMTADLAEH